MAKYLYTNSNITFSSVEVDVKPLKMIGGKMQSSTADYSDGEVGTLINAVEIDWNGAQLGNNYQSKLVKLVVRLIVRTKSIS